MASSPRRLPNPPSASVQQPIAQQLARLASKRQQAAQQLTTRSSPHPPSGQHQKGKWKAWTGFSGKTFRNWLQLLAQIIGAFAIPISIIGLFISVRQFNVQQQNNAQQAFEQQQHNAQQALDQQQQITLETYLDHMSDLLLTDKLNKSKPADEVRAVARARTLAALQNLNPVRKRILLQFLYEAGLIGGPAAGLPLDLSNADLGKAFLEGLNLQFAELSGVNLSMADFSHANLFGADLNYANLSRTNLNHDNLIKTHLINAWLPGADLSGADLSGADLSNADLSNADLSNADLRGANLNRAIINQSQLDQVTSCLGAILPKGITCHQ